jgi:hypothetical protein
MRRFLPLGLFAAIQAFVLVALVVAAGTDRLGWISAVAGALLLAIALATAFSDWMSIKSYLAVSALVGAAIIVTALVTRATPEADGSAAASPVPTYVLGALLVLSGLLALRRSSKPGPLKAAG